MKFPRRPGATHLSEIVLRNLNSYALAASAAGVGILALAQPAESEIIYTKTHTNITPNTTLQLDLNHDGIVDFQLKDTFSRGLGWSYGQINAAPAQKNNQVWGHTYLQRYAYGSAFYAGVEIGPKGQFLAGSALMARTSFNGGVAVRGASCTSPWANVTNRYLGLKFAISGEAHFGWARLSVSCSQTHIGAVLTGYAYETVANRPIITGKTTGTDENENTFQPLPSDEKPVVQPATLGRLALGAAGRSE
jgi:hypothetical protein